LKGIERKTALHTNNCEDEFMNNQFNIELFLNLVDGTIHNNINIDHEFQKVNWERIYELSSRNMLIALLYDTVQKLSVQYNICENLLLKWKNAALSYMLSEVNKYMILNKILSIAKEQNITLILLKGCILADLYPNYLTRISCDTDILVYERDKESVTRLLESLGFRKSCFSKGSVFNYILDSAHYEIELHFSLWEDYKGSKINILNCMQLTKEESLIHRKVCGLEVTTLGYEEHFIFLIFHIVKHFSLQGSNLRSLIDITLYFNKYQPYINLKSFWDKIELLSYTKFCENIFTICIKHFGMSPKIIENRNIQLIDNMDEFLSDLMNIGPGYEKRTASWNVTGIIKPYFLGEQEIPKSKLHRMIRILFPAPNACLDPYVRKHPILAPMVWGSRCHLYLFKMHKSRNLFYDFKERMTLSEIRLSLMYSLDLAERAK
jgi:hypothetical protein